MLAQPLADRPKLLANPAARGARITQLHEPHIAPLTAFVETLRAQVGPDVSIPNFDPWDGGIDAEILYLLEAPGPQAVLSGFVSRNNPDESAKNFFELNAQAEIPRERTITWNVVPWYIGDRNRVRAANRTDLQAGIRDLPPLFSILPRLCAVVLVGRKAQQARSAVRHLLPTVAIFECPHPSPQFVNRDPANRHRILDVLHNVSDFVISRANAQAM
jgi:uracil-DNA glycosylase